MFQQILLHAAFRRELSGIGRIMLMQLNFILVAIVNLGLFLLPFSWLKVFWLRLWQKNVSYSSSIQRGVRITSVLGELSIGDNSIVGVNVLLDNRRGIFIGENVNISRECKILTLGHDYNHEDFVAKGAPVVIEKSAWVFMGVKVMPGVVVAENSVVFSFSVVTKSTDKYYAYGGVPAIKIRGPVASRSKQKPYRFFFAF